MKRILLLVILLIGLCIALYPLITRPSNVIVILLDTTRADHMSLYDYKRETTPFLKSLKSSFSVAKRAIAPAPWTPPSVASLFTGLYAVSHKMMPPDGQSLAKKTSTKLGDEALTAAEIYKAAGYQTYAVSSNPWIKPEFGYDQGFDVFQYLSWGKAGEVVNRAEEIIKNLNPWRPYFLYLHFLDPHDPYEPPKEFLGHFTPEAVTENYSASMRDKMDRYHGELLYLDSELERLFGILKDSDAFDDTIIVIAGDHGEQFEEHGDWGHGFSLFNEEINVPLMIRAKDLPAEILETVSLVDVLPTLIKATRVKTTQVFQGLHLQDPDGRKYRAGVLSEIKRKNNFRSLTTPDGARIIEIRTNDVSYDTDSQAESTLICTANGKCSEDLSPDDSIILKSNLAKSYSKFKETSLTQEFSTPADATLDELRSLGYLH